MKIKWADLHDIGTSKVVNTSFIWLALIPFLARALDALHSAGAAVPQLPLNFVAFYYSAFFFAIGALLFNVFCPKILKLAPSYGAFAAGGFSLLELKHWFHDMADAASDKTSRDPVLIRQFLSHLKGANNLTAGHATDIMRGTAGPTLLGEYWACPPVSDQALAEVHDLSVREAEKRNAGWRAITAVCYALGFALFATVAVVNLVVVVRATIPALSGFFRGG